jgi:hypothetical protein
MNRALYGYFGGITEHNGEFPGHPLYQLNFLDSLSNAFNIDKFDILYYNPNVPMFNFSIHQAIRNNMYDNLIDKTYSPITRYMPRLDFSKYDAFFLKHRFENSSRLKDMKGIDVECYEFAIRLALFTNKPIYLIDSDAEIMSDFRFWKDKIRTNVNVLTFFQNPPNYPVNTIKISPTSRVLLDQVQATPEKCATFKVFSYDGNNYLKSDALSLLLNQIQYRHYFDDVYVLGKNWEKIYTLYPRDKRIEFYHDRRNLSYASVNITKDTYQEKSFASPRVVESFMVGEYIYAPKEYLYMPENLKFGDFIEFYHKMIYGVQTWSKETLLKYAEEYLSKLKDGGFVGL